MKKKLRIGVLVDDFLVPLWAYEMLEEIKSSEHSDINLIIKKDNVAQISKSNFLYRFLRDRKKIVYKYYNSLIENKLFKIKNDAFYKKDIKNLLNCDELLVSTKETKFSDRFEVGDIEKIKEYKIDVLIRLGFKILRGEILSSSKYGIWSFHHGDNAINRGGPPGVWEVLENREESGFTLQILTEDLDGGVKLYKGYLTSDSISFKRNRNNCHWKSSPYISKKLRELYNLGEKKFFDNIKELNSYPEFYYNRLYKEPKNLEFLMKSLKNFYSYFLSKIQKMFFFEQWILLYKFNNKSEISKSFFRFKRIIPPKDRFWADPFIFKKNSEYYVFFEELIYEENKGRISVSKIDKKGNFTKPEVVLDEPYHLSYPFLLEEENDVYMIPETAENNTINIYKCVEFPNKWEFKKSLIKNIKAYDTTIFKFDEKYWLFCSVVDHKNIESSDELHIFYSKSLFNDEWTPHPSNPLISDFKSARPAGNIFKYKDKIFRPSQNASRHYGYGIQLNEIVELSEFSYTEKHIQPIYPEWDNDVTSIHTLNNLDELTVIDAMIRRSKFNIFKR